MVSQLVPTPRMLSARPWLAPPCAMAWLLAGSVGTTACDPATPSVGQDAPTASRGGSATVDAGEPTEERLASPAPEPDPKALEELLEAAPAQRLPSTGPDGGTLVGTDTELPLEDDAHRHGKGAGAEAPPRGVLRVGAIEVQPGPSNAAIESAMRAQIYWPLVHKCRDANGDMLPPDAVTLSFTVRIDGTVDPGSVSATGAERRFDEAADCMMRAFSAIAFRGPASSVGQPSRVVATIPSVD